MTTQPLALMVVSARGRRPVVAMVADDTRMGDLAAALGAPSDSIHKLGQLLDRNALLLDAGVRSGDTLHLGVTGDVALRQLGPELRIVGGIGAGLRRRVDGRPLVLGRGADADVMLAGDRVSRRHAQVVWGDDRFAVRDLGSRNGVRVEGELIPVGVDVMVAPGTPVRIGDTVFTVVGTSESRPRAASSPPSLRLATSASIHPRRSLAPFVVPSAGAVALAATASGAPAPVALAATPAAVVVGLLADRGMTARASRKAAAARSARIDDARSDVRGAAAAFAAGERARLLDPATLAAAVERKARGVWSTPLRDVELRVGLAADVVAVTLDGERGDVDRLTDERTAHVVPRGVRLGDAPVVVAGPESFLDHLFDWMVMQVAVRVSPRELDLVVISDDTERWAWSAWLPHAAGQAVLPRNAVPSQLPARRGAQRVIVLDHPTSERWVDHAGDLVLWRAERVDRAGPNHATRIVASSPLHVRIEEAAGETDELLADVVTEADAGLLLALDLASNDAPRPTDTTRDALFLDEVTPSVGRTDDIMRAWQSIPEALDAVIGTSHGEPVHVRLEGQNSHALVAGTTGSGKTRLLETLVVGLAATNAPSALHVLVIDFKGGNELVGLTRLPHCVGFVSDREPNEVDRAIAALTREVARRDDAFAAVGATDVVDFATKSHAPMPRLLVVADEFGQFRRDDARGSRVATLLRIAAQGRSKGIHLVLATQTPSTDVTTDIRQNVGVRLCLRVAEASESMAVLGVPFAADLPRTPGRVLVATGDEICEAQVALTRGVRTRSDDVVWVRDLVDVANGLFERPPVDSDEVFDELVETIATAAAIACDTPAPLLPPPLADQIDRADLFGASRPWTERGLVLAARDRPGVAAPPPFAFDLVRDGALTIVGGPRSGRTTALLALADAAIHQADAARELVVHAIDWAGDELRSIEGTTVDGGVVRRGDLEHLRRLIRWLGAGRPEVTRLILVDRLDALVRDLREIDGGALATDLVDALNTGPSRGVFAAVTLDAAGLLGNALTSLAGPRLILRVDDPTLAAAAGLPRRESIGPGRAVVLPGGDELQIGEPSAFARVHAAPLRSRVAPMPTRVDAGDLPVAESEHVVLGLGGRTRVAAVTVNLDAAGPIVAVIGRARSGRSTALETIANTYRGDRSVTRLFRGGDESWDPSAPPSLVVVDDAARAALAHPWLTNPELADELEAGRHVLVASFDQAELNALGFSHWLMRRPRPGLLLSLDATPDRIVAAERVGFHPPAELRVGPAGRGWWCDRGGAVPVQIARTN